MTLPRLVVLAVALALASATGAFADSLNVVAGDTVWHAFQTPSTTSGTAFWNNSSFDGTNHDCNIGYWLSGTGGCNTNGGTFLNNSPAVTPNYLGSADTRFQFTKEPASASVTVSTQVQATTWTPTNEVGWYQVANPTQLNPLFGRFNPPSGTATFVPAGDYGFYISSKHGTYLSGTTQGTQSHFAVFQLAGTGHYVLGTEDMWYGSDWDYNDVVLDVQVNPVPEPATLMLMGTGLIALLARERRRSARR